jgi:glycosyltransferase involved in cell wall biosynthesis
VVFAGQRPDAAELMGEVDVVALPSSIEGLPLVLLEAMARRRAIIATPVGGTPELVVDGETGLLVPPRDPRALADAIRRLLSDPGIREHMGAAGQRRVADHFTADAMSQRVLRLYDEVVAG